MDGAGNAYMTGPTYSTNFPTRNALYSQYGGGVYDAFIAKLNASGTALVYSTYLGGSSYDEGLGISMDNAGNAYVTGETESADFPTRNALYPNFRGAGDAFITKIADASSTSTLTVSITGSGTVYSTPSGINCGSDCTHNYTKGTMLILKALPATGYVFSGWGVACLGVTTDYCTLTMDANKSASAVFKTKTPEKENPQTRYGDGTGICTAPQTGRNAVLITHGWNADTKKWVLLMAGDICYKIGSPSIGLPASNALKKLCTGGLWDVFVADWSDLACGNIYCATPKQAWNNAPRIGEAVAKKLRSCDYQHLHLIAHSAGSNVIEWVAGIIKTTWENPPTIHQTFLDPYDPAAPAHPTRSGRQNSAYGGNDGKNGKKQWSADWADNYVDLRPIFIEALDKTELYLSAAYNVNVTPAGNCEGADDINDTCKHGRPYRFYGKSINPDFFDSFNNHNTVDPITSTAGMGYPLSVEAGWHLADLNQQYGKGKECHVIDSNCQDSPPPSPANKVYVAANASGAVVDRSGIAQCVVGALVIPCSQIGLTTGAVTSAALAESPEAQAADAPTRAPAWLAMQIQTTQPPTPYAFPTVRGGRRGPAAGVRQRKHSAGNRPALRAHRFDGTRKRLRRRPRAGDVQDRLPAGRLRRHHQRCNIDRHRVKPTETGCRYPARRHQIRHRFRYGHQQ